MKIFINNENVDISDKVLEAEKNLKESKLFVLESQDHTDHLAAYKAWTNVGGNILVKSPLLPTEQKQSLDEEVRLRDFENSIIFHTSGTTGKPKIVVHKQQQMTQSVKMATKNLNWDKTSNFLNFIPPSTSGFWHIVVAPLIHYGASVTIGSKETIADDFKSNTNIVVLVPALIDQIRMRKIDIDLSKYKKIGCGGSQVLQRHVEFCFSKGAQVFNHIYGQTETCSPILGRESISADDEYAVYLEKDPAADCISKIVDGELWIKGLSVCDNLQDFDHEDGWIKTGDIWEEKNNLIKFVGRKNDIVKMNGYFSSLTLIENILEEETSIGDTIAIPRNSLGSDWIEVFYTNKNANVDKERFFKIFELKVPKCNIPLKYTYVESIPRNSLGKKLRNDF